MLREKVRDMFDQKMTYVYVHRGTNLAGFNGKKNYFLPESFIVRRFKAKKIICVSQTDRKLGVSRGWPNGRFDLEFIDLPPLHF